MKCIQMDSVLVQKVVIWIRHMGLLYVGLMPLLMIAECALRMQAMKFAKAARTVGMQIFGMKIVCRSIQTVISLVKLKTR